MMHAEQVQAASEALKARRDPYGRAVSDWLRDEARHISADVARWPRHRSFDDIDAFTKIFYRHPLAVSRAILDETLVSPAERT